MRNIFLFSFLALLFFSQCTPKTGDKVSKAKDKVEEVKDDFRKMAPTPGPAPKIQLGSYEQYELANGLKVIVVENRKLPRVTWSLSLDNDPFMENDKTGAASMAGTLMAHGTTSKTKAQIDEEVDFLGATLNTSSSGMFGASLTKHSDKLLAVMSDVLLNPSFPEGEFDKVKKQTISGLASSKDDANSIASNVGNVKAYGKLHPYGEVTTEETVENISLDDIKKYYKNYMRPNNAYLIVVGDINGADAKAKAEQYFGSWKKGDVPNNVFAKPYAPQKTEIGFVNKSGAVQSVINVTYPVDLQPGSEDAIKARVMNTLLGGFFRSRLNGNLREDKGYTYGIRSRLQSDKEVGAFTASAGVRNEVTDSAIMQIMYEFNRLKTEPVPAKELDLVKNYLSGSFARSLENPQTVARFALNTIKYGLPKDYYTSYLENLSNVTAADLMAMANKYIKPDNAHVIVVGNKAEVADKLKKLKPVKFYSIYGEEVKENIEIPAGTTAESVIANYVKAIGGKAKLDAARDVVIKMKADMMGQSLSVDVYMMDGKSSNTASMSGMGVMSKEVYNNGKAMKMEMGQKAPIDDKTLNSMKENSILFPETDMASHGYKMVLQGAEPINGVNAYVIDIESASGNKETQYFSMDSFLRIRTVNTQGPATLTFDLKDYKEVDGIMFPHTTEISGMAPVPLTMTTESILVNKGIDDAKFKTE